MLKKKMRISEEVDLHIFDTDILNILFLSISEIIAPPMGNIATDTPAVEELLTSY